MLSASNVIPPSHLAIQDVVAMANRHGYLDQSQEFILAFHLDDRIVFICQDHNEGNYLVSSWLKQSNDYRAMPYHEGTLYDCVQYVNKTFNRDYQVLH